MKTGAKKRSRSPFVKRAHSSSPSTVKRAKSPVPAKKSILERRCQSLSPSAQGSTKSLQPMGAARAIPATSYTIPPVQDAFFNTTSTTESEHSTDKDPTLPQSVVTKMLRTLATKKREFLKLRRILIQQQNSLLENYAALKDLEFRAGVNLEESLGEIKVLSVTSWPAHDLLLLLRDDLHVPTKSEIGGHLGMQILQQLNAHLDPVPEEVLSMGAELMARRIDLVNLLRSRLRSERGAYNTNLEWKTKNTELDNETEKLHRMVAGTAENLKDKINFCLDLARVPWIDREAMVKKIERLQKENMLLQNKIDELNKRDEERKEGDWAQNSPAYQTVIEELCKERAAREALKEVVSTAEGMLRVARARIATLERQLKETRSELDAARRKHKDLEQLYRHRESSYDARSKKLMEVSKTGELTIEALSRQRDALELRVKELHEQAETAERTAEKHEAELRARAEALQVKVTEQDKNRIAAENRVIKLEMRVEELEEQLRSIRERSVKLVDMERRRCLEFVPTKENEPTDKETEIWKELQFTKASLSRAEEELRQSRADKDNFLNSLSKIAQGEGSDNFRDKMSVELLDREQKIYKLQRIIEEQRENDRVMEQTMTQYENQLAALRLEVMRLRNYDCYYKEVPQQELQTELLETHMQVETLTRERSALVTAAASRALMLERHERSAELFARTTRARRELAALLECRQEPPLMEEVVHAEVSRSLSSMCATAADTWSALRAERARVIRLESAVLAQSLQLEREGRVRTQLERRRAILEREVLRAQHATTSEHSAMNKHPSLVKPKHDQTGTRTQRHVPLGIEPRPPDTKHFLE